MIPLKVIAEYRLYKDGKLVDSDRKEIIIPSEEKGADCEK